MPRAARRGGRACAFRSKSGVGRLLRREVRPARQQLPRQHMVERPVDGLHADQPVAAEAEHRERAARRRIAAHHRPLVRRRQAGDLQLQRALVAPEPRHGRVGRGPAGEAGRDAPSLVHGVLHRFEPRRAGAGCCEAAGIARAIADCGDRRVAGQRGARPPRSRRRRRAPPRRRAPRSARRRCRPARGRPGSAVRRRSPRPSRARPPRRGCAPRSPRTRSARPGARARRGKRRTSRARASGPSAGRWPRPPSPPRRPPRRRRRIPGR